MWETGPERRTSFPAEDCFVTAPDRRRRWASVSVSDWSCSICCVSTAAGNETEAAGTQVTPGASSPFHPLLGAELLSTAAWESVASRRGARCGGRASAVLLEEAGAPRRSSCRCSAGWEERCCSTPAEARSPGKMALTDTGPSCLAADAPHCRVSGSAAAASCSGSSAADLASQFGNLAAAWLREASDSDRCRALNPRAGTAVHTPGTDRANSNTPASAAAAAAG